MKLYRLTYLISPKLDKEQAIQLQEKLIVFLQEKGGKVQTNKEITKRELAYPIHKEKLAYLADCSFSLPLSELPALKKFLRNTNDIMRSLLINTKPTVTKATSHKPNPQNKEKKENEESVDEKLDRILES